MQVDQVHIDRPFQRIIHLIRNLRADQTRIDLNQVGSVVGDNHLDVSGAEVEINGIKNLKSVIADGLGVVSVRGKTTTPHSEGRWGKHHFVVDAKQSALPVVRENVATDHVATNVFLDRKAIAGLDTQ